MSALNKKACPEIHLLEAYVSNQISPSERKIISHHIDSCRRCHALATEFYQYYKILEQENSRPVSSTVFKLINDVVNASIAGILLHSDDMSSPNRSLEYHSEIIFLTQQDIIADIDDLDCIPVYDNEIFIRAIQYQVNHETTLFLYANDKKLYRNVQMKFKTSTEFFVSDPIGKIELGQFDITDLDKQHIIIIPEGD